MNRQEAEALITEKLAALTSHDDWLRVLTLAQSFNQYSFGNRILIAVQCNNPTYVAGFQTWKKHGRWVKKGEKAIRILAPLVRKDPADPEADPQVFGFKAASVFNLDQTDGEPFEVPEATLLTGTSGAELLAHLQSVAPVPIQWVDPMVLDGANGDYHLETHVIRVRNDVDPNQQAKTLLHELAHHFGHQEGSPRLPRDFEECAAESAAYIVAGLHGLDTAPFSATYVAHWAGGNPGVTHQLVKTVSARVQALEALLGITVADPDIAA